eukprot:2862050-Amphidinium_carterae.1
MEIVLRCEPAIQAIPRCHYGCTSVCFCCHDFCQHNMDDMPGESRFGLTIQELMLQKSQCTLCT